MRIISIGDLHGKNHWEKVINKYDFDLLIFVGDYFDNLSGISNKEEILNFKNLLKYKEKYPDKVIILIGNHELHYLKGINEKYSGFQTIHKYDIQDILEEALSKNYLKACHLEDNFLFSHAGVTKTWLNNVGYDYEEKIDIFINDLFKYKPQNFKFTIGNNLSGYGDDICQSPLWVRPNSLIKDCVDGYNQVVGHTEDYQITSIDNNLFFIDSFTISDTFIEIVDGNVNVLGL
jgi:predicted MPP superfamily phosphohydrolase